MDGTVGHRKDQDRHSFDFESLKNSRIRHSEHSLNGFHSRYVPWEMVYGEKTEEEDVG